MRPITPIQYDFYKRRMPELIARFPHLFDKRFPIPLAIGITQEIADWSEFSYLEASVLLKVWCARNEYKMMMCSVGSRQDTQGNMTLLEAKHLDHAASFLPHIHRKRISTFARAFRLEYGLNPFKLIPEDKNPENQEGYKPKPVPNFIAELHNVTIDRRIGSEDTEVSYGLAYGVIMNDRATYGNHPLRDGAGIHTNYVTQIWEVAGYTFIKTNSDSIYLIRGEITFRDQ